MTTNHIKSMSNILNYAVSIAGHLPIILTTAQRLKDIILIDRVLNLKEFRSLTFHVALVKVERDKEPFSERKHLNLLMNTSKIREQVTE